MAISSLSSVLTSGFISRISSTSSSSTSSSLFSSSSTDTAATFSSVSLKRGAATLAGSVQRLNLGIAFVQDARDSLGGLEKILNKVVDLADRAAKSTSSSQRDNLNSEYRKLAGEFKKIVEKSGDSQFDPLNVVDFTTTLTNLGLDPEQAKTVAEFFSKLKFPSSDENLASDAVKGRRPLQVPTTDETVYTSSGVLAARTDLTTGVDGAEPVAADFNSDGNVDLVVGASNSNAALLLSGNGDGTFSAGASIGSFSNPGAGVSGDLDGNGIADLVFLHSDTSTFGVLLGNGDGTFRAEVSYAVPVSANGLAIGDLDGDNRPDLLVATNDGFATFLNNGVGVFSAGASESISIGANYSGVAIGNYNGASGNDIVATSTTVPEVELRANDGSGGFASAFTDLTNGAGSAYQARLDDLNGDGRLDVVTGASGDPTVSVFFGNGDGTFSARLSLAVTGSSVTSLAVGDVTGDGNADIVAGVGDSINVFAGAGDGTFAAAVSYASSGSNVTGLAITDVDNDGFKDVVANDAASQSIGVFRQSTTSSTQPASEPRATEWSSVFASGRTIHYRSDAVALREDAKALRDQVRDNIKALDQGLDVLDKNLGLVRETGLGFLRVADSLSGAEAADKVASSVRDEIRKSGSQYLSQLDNLNPIVAATLLASSSKG